MIYEQGTDIAEAAWGAADRSTSSILLYAETRSAFARARHDARVSVRELRSARTVVERLWAQVDRVDVTEKVSRHAGDLAERHGLRAYDAVHLASAISIADDLVFVAADADLLAAAAAHELETAPAL